MILFCILSTGHLRKELKLHLLKMFEDRIPVFKNIPRNILKDIIEKLEIEYFMPNDIVNNIQIKTRLIILIF